MTTTTRPRLTAHQDRVLAIVEAGGAHGVAIESVLREEYALTGRLRGSVFDTVWSLVRRGLIRQTVTLETGLTDEGRVYGIERRRLFVA